MLTRGRVPALRSFAILLVLLAGCSNDPATEDDGTLQVVTTVSPITNIVQNIGGDRVRITGIVPEGINSHTFEPAPSDAAVMEEADIVFMNGLDLEEPTMDLAAAHVGEGVPVIELAREAVTEDEWIFDRSFPAEGGDPNPHLWTHPLHARRFAEVVMAQLSLLDPGGAATYERNFEAFAARLDELDAAVREVTATVPEGNRKLLTYHDSFPYFAREYGWTIVGAIQPSDFSDPTPQEVAGLIEQIRAEGIPAIFGSEVFASPVLEQIAAEGGATYIDDLRDDDLPGEPGDADHSYLGLMVFDFTTFMGALGGDTAAFERIDTSNLHEGNATYRT